MEGMVIFPGGIQAGIEQGSIYMYMCKFQKEARSMMCLPA